MHILKKESLAGTLDALNDMFFFGKTMDETDARETAEWLLSRQGLPGSYANMFAPTEKDYSEGIRLFTGERITTNAATGHILGEETCRALLLLSESHGLNVDDGLSRAMSSMDQCLTNSETELGRSGFF